jgi:soluble lytic murein transglycosylase
MLALLYGGLVSMRVLWPVDFVDIVLREAAQKALDPDLIGAVIYAESRYDPNAVSPRGALGLMQIMPETGVWIAQQLGLPDSADLDLFDAELNIRFGAWYLRHLLDRFGDLEAALEAYNAGPSNVAAWLAEGTGPYPETSAFTRRVLTARPIYRFYCRFPDLIRITSSVSF